MPTKINSFALIPGVFIKIIFSTDLNERLIHCYEWEFARNGTQNFWRLNSGFKRYQISHQFLEVSSFGKVSQRLVQFHESYGQICKI